MEMEASKGSDSPDGIMYSRLGDPTTRDLLSHCAGVVAYLPLGVTRSVAIMPAFRNAKQGKARHGKARHRRAGQDSLAGAFFVDRFGRAAQRRRHGQPPAPAKPFRKGRLTVIGCVLFAALALIIGAIAGEEQATVQALGGLAGVLAVSVLAALAVVVAVVWILFPVFVYFAMTRIEDLLKKIQQGRRD